MLVFTLNIIYRSFDEIHLKPSLVYRWVESAPLRTGIECSSQPLPKPKIYYRLYSSINR